MEIKLNVTIVKDGVTCAMSAKVLEVQDPLNSQKGQCNRTSPNTQAEHGVSDSTGTEPQPTDAPPEPPANPSAAMELIGRENEANIFISDIWVTAIIDTGAQVFYNYLGFP